MARPTKRSPEREQAILGALRLGNTRRNAAAYAEIDHATFYRWIETDATFRDSVEKAESDAEARFLGVIAKAAHEGTWTAAAWWLERRRHEDYRKREGVEITGRDGGPIESRDVTNTLSDSDLREALREAERLAVAGRAAPEAPGAPEG
jgi:hypothetical protein